MRIPKMISVDDHVIEPPMLWQDRLPSRYRGIGPRVERTKIAGASRASLGKIDLNVTSDSQDVRTVDLWRYEELAWPMSRGFAHSGYEDEDGLCGITYDEMLPACYDKVARVATLNENHTEVSFTFPTFPRFCGQTFHEAKDKELALLCVRAYNDWMIDDWCAGVAYGRLIPLTLVPLWDVQLAAAEVRRCAAKGSHAIAFTEQPVHLGMPSLHSGYWDLLWQACEETETVVNMHIGSSSKLPTTSDDAPIEVLMSINTQNSIQAFVDWMLSGIFVRYPTVKVALSEGQVGWIPYYVNRMDQLWHQNIWNRIQTRIPKPPSEYVKGRIYGCIFDDPVGLRNRDLVGMSQIMIETDFPHADSTYPNSKAITEKIAAAAGLDEHETWQLVRGNAIECYGLHRWGITK